MHGGADTMMKRVFVLGLALTMLVGCGESGEHVIAQTRRPRTLQAEGTSEHSSTSKYFSTSTTSASPSSPLPEGEGRVRVPAHRIVALAPSITELVYAAGAGQYLVGTVNYGDYPQQAKSLPHVGDAFRVDLERLLALKPDLILVWPSGTPNVLEQVRSLGLRVEEIEAQRMSEVGAALLRIGELAGTQTVAQQAAQQFSEGVTRLRQRYAQRKLLQVFIEVNRQPLYTVSKQQIISEVVELCGGRNVFAEIGQLAPQISIEAVLKVNPQVILSTDGSAAQIKQDWQAWPQLTAVKQQRIYAVSPDLVTRAAPRLLQGAEEVCRVLEAARGSE